MAGPVEAAIRAKLTDGMKLTTFGQSKEFELHMKDTGLVLLQGKTRSPARLTWRCLEDVPSFMRGGGEGWLPAGGSRSAKGKPGTLDEYFKLHIKRDVARWMARVLWEAGIVDVQHGRLLQVRLRPGF